jgi:serine/threonine protein kinase
MTPDALTRFKREASVLTRLVHPNLVQLFAAGEAEDGLPIMVLEWVDGPSLSSLMGEHRRFDWVDAAEPLRARWRWRTRMTCCIATSSRPTF